MITKNLILFYAKRWNLILFKFRFDRRAIFTEELLSINLVQS